MLNLELDINGILKVTAMEKRTGLSKAVTMDTKNVKPHLDIAEAQKTSRPCCQMRRNMRTLKLPTSLSKNIDGGEPDKQPLLAKAKELRKRAEKLLGSIAEDDAKDIRDMLEKTARR